MSYTPKIPQVVSLTSPSLAALNARLSKGLDALRVKEESGDTGEQYRQWLCTWERLLAQYEDALDRLAAQGGPACDHAPCKAETCAECKTLPLETMATAAMAAAWRVGLRAPGISSEAQVTNLARQLTLFAGSTPILALPRLEGGEQDEQDADED